MNYINSNQQQESSAIYSKINLWKDSLLDTSRRNRMINYKETKRSTLKICEPSIKELFNKLAVAEKTLTFKRSVDMKSDVRTYYMLSLLKTLSYDIPVFIGDIKANCNIANQEKTLKNLRQRARLAQEEQGINILYLSFGFIEWRYEEKIVRSPLLMMPVRIGLRSLNAPYTLCKDDDEIEVNPTLSYLFSQNYGINLPEFQLQNGESLEKYFEEIENLVDKKGWKLIREVSLDVMSFLKITMYHDLNDNMEKLTNNQIIKAICGEHNDITKLPTDINRLNLDETKPEEWYEILDSDASQGKAIYLSKRNCSFVMQGPPGTGKSQTITNIIAQALGEGKKVLFVAEKSAALDVVRKRLTEVNLDRFCLSLHNHKVNKKEIIEDIVSNLKLSEKFVNNEDYVSLNKLSQTREYLNDYVTQLHQKITPFNTSLYEIIGKLSKLENIKDIDFNIDNILGISKEEYYTFLSSIENFEMSLLNLDGKISDNPWHGIAITTCNQEYKEKLCADIQELLTLLQTVKDFKLSFEEISSAVISDTWDKIQKEVEFIEDLMRLPKYYLSVLNDNKTRNNLVNRAKKEREDFEQENAYGQKFSELIKNFEAKWNVNEINFSLDDIKTVFFEIKNITNVINVSDCNLLLEKISNVIKIIKEMSHDYQAVNNMFKIGDEDSIRNIKKLSQLLTILLSNPKINYYLLNIDNYQDYKDKVSEIRIHQNILNSRIEELKCEWNPDLFKLDVDEMLERFITEYDGIFFYRFNKNYKSDIKKFMLCSKKVLDNFSKNDAINLLMKLKNINFEKAWFVDNKHKFETLFPNDYKGIETDCDKLIDSINAVVAISNLFEYNVIPQNIKDTISNIQNDSLLTLELKKYLDLLSNDKIEECVNVIKTVNNNFDDNLSLKNELLVSFENQIENISEKIAIIKTFKNTTTLTTDDIKLMIDYASNINNYLTWFLNHIPNILTELNFNYKNETIRDNIENSKIILENYIPFLQKKKSQELRTLFDIRYDGINTNWKSIVDDIEKFEALRKTSNFSNLLGIKERILNDNNYNEFKNNLASEIGKLKEILKKSEPVIEYFSELFPKDKIKQISFDMIMWNCYSRLENIDLLDKWLSCKRAKSECDDLGLSNFTDKILEYDNTIFDIQKVFERGFYRKLLNSAILKYKLNSVENFNSSIYKQKLNSFVSNDVSQLKLSVERIYEHNLKYFPQQNIFSNLDSEVRILTHENEKKRRVKPIRKLFNEIPNLLLTLKPCLMMSPLSVAHFLNADEFNFDIVIFDEASQIFPEDAIGAIFRGKQIIIAGDTKQLPPTNFFLSNSSSDGEEFDDDDENFEDEVYDSILEEAASVFPNITLLWHYRSKYEGLIAFSNKEIYKNELITFPSVNENKPNTGVELIYVEDGEYISGGKNCNIPEAKKCVELVKEHIINYPNRSLGIIAFSSKQQDVILQEIQKFREENEQYENFFSEDKEEAFFVKNLENVQGDERDTIIFSICYGKTKEQKEKGKAMALRFGPLGRAGGERRLNVAITRAKVNIKLVSSIKPEDINIQKTESIGIRMLRSYIEYAKNSSNYSNSREYINIHDDFVDTIYNFLSELGYSVKKNIGYSNCKIDLAVENPQNQGEFVVGIECDGKNYTLSQTARDRFRLRGSILSSMGWNMYHVWSKEWYNNPKQERENLLKFINYEIKKRNKESLQITTNVDSSNNNNEQNIAEENTSNIQNNDNVTVVSNDNNIHTDVHENNINNNSSLNVRNSSNDICEELLARGFNIIDNRNASKIIWVLYQDDKVNEFEKLMRDFKVDYRLYKRGPIATNYKPSWLIIIKGANNGR